MKTSLKSLLLLVGCCACLIVGIEHLGKTRVVILNNTGEKVRNVTILVEDDQYSVGIIRNGQKQSVLVKCDSDSTIVVSGEGESGKMYRTSAYASVQFVGGTERMELEKETCAQSLSH